MKTAIKYAPQNLEEVIYPSVAVQKRIDAYAKGHLEGHVLLWGPNGSSKTTVANLLPYAIGGQDALVEDKEFDELLANKDLKLYKESPELYLNYKNLNVGRILGIVGIVLSALTLLAYVYLYSLGPEKLLEFQKNLEAKAKYQQEQGQ